MDISNVKIGFLGMGSMGKAMVRGWLKSKQISPRQMGAYRRNQRALNSWAAQTDTLAFETPEKLVEWADVVILAVKSKNLHEVLMPLEDLLAKKIVVSVAVQGTYKFLRGFFVQETEFLSVLPNTPVAVGKGIICCEAKHTLTPAHFNFVNQLLGYLGEVVHLPEQEYAAASCLTGCGPAFIALMMEALADGAVKQGLSRDMAYLLSSRLMEGTAALQSEHELIPAQIKDQVCSPGGTTIRGIYAMEQNGLRHAVMSALEASIQQDS